ncbi:MAG: hypothetical protein M1298_00060 [Chloroflexi bacterium]|nr:hypothetical protein [Chloroflexota bacterium]
MARRPAVQVVPLVSDPSRAVGAGVGQQHSLECDLVLLTIAQPVDDTIRVAGDGDVAQHAAGGGGVIEPATAARASAVAADGAVVNRHSRGALGLVVNATAVAHRAIVADSAS